MKKHYKVNYNGEKLSFNHHKEVAEQIKEHYKYDLLYTWADKWQETFKIGGETFLVIDLIESWTGYASNAISRTLHERLANSFYNDFFASDIKWIIEENEEKIKNGPAIFGIDFSDFDFSISIEDGEV